MIKIYKLILVSLMFFCSLCVAENELDNDLETSCSNKPTAYQINIVSDAITASKIAEATMTPIYGKEAIERQLPLKANLRGCKWIVTGTFSSGWFSHKVGGVVEVEISRADGRIISFTHGK